MNAGGNVIPAAGRRRSARGQRGERAPCRTPRGAPLSAPQALGVHYLRISQLPRLYEPAHPAPTALRPLGVGGGRLG